MKLSYYLIGLLLGVTTWAYGQKKPKINSNKKAIIASIDAKSQALTDLSDKIWGFEEVAFQETQSAKALSDFASDQGFKVTTGVADIPTAFVAEYGSGKPIIAIMGEFDALPGLSQKTVPHKDPLNVGGAGHGLEFRCAA